MYTVQEQEMKRNYEYEHKINAFVEVHTRSRLLEKICSKLQDTLFGLYHCQVKQNVKYHNS